MALIITIQCLKKIICNKNILNICMIIIFFIKYMSYRNAHDRTILIFLNVIMLNVSLNTEWIVTIKVYVYL